MYCILCMFGITPINADNQLYQEKGEITVINKKASVQMQGGELKEDIDVNELISQIGDKEDAKISFAIFKFQEETIDGKNELVPMTVSDVKAVRSVKKASKKVYNLTFSLTVSSSTSNGKRKVNTSTYMYWNPGIDFDHEHIVDSGTTDYASISYPKPFKININNSNGGLSGNGATSKNLKDINSYAAVSSFKEQFGACYMKASSSYYKTVKKSRRFVAKYLHTWTKMQPSISLGVGSEGGTVTFGMQGTDAMWQTALYVDYDC